MRSLETLLNKAKKLYSIVVDWQGVRATKVVVCGLLSRSLSGLLILRDVGGDPVNDMLLLTAREF